MNLNQKFYLLIRPKKIDTQISYTKIKSSVYNTINLEFPKDVESFEDIPDESYYYYMENWEKFVFYKDS